MTTYFSQFNEDRILARIFQKRRTGMCVEVGANDGVHGSTTLYFEKLGWQCILVEPIPALCDEIRAARAGTLFECAASNHRGVVTLHVVEGPWSASAMSTISEHQKDRERIRQLGFTTRPIRVPTRTLDDILVTAGAQPGIDFVSIDVEGHEREVLEGFSLQRWRPRIVIVEDNSNATSSATVDQLAVHGYVRFKRTGVNDWFASRTDRELVNLRSRLALRVTLPGIRARAFLVPLLCKLTNMLRRMVRRPQRTA